MAAQCAPAHEEEQAAERRDGAKPSPPGARQQIQVAGKQEDTGSQAPACQAQRSRLARGGQQAQRQQCRGMKHLIVNGRLPDRELRGRQRILQGVGTEGSQ